MTRRAVAGRVPRPNRTCLLYTSDAADERSSVDLGGRRIIKKKNNITDGGAAAAKKRTTTDKRLQNIRTTNTEKKDCETVT